MGKRMKEKKETRSHRKLTVEEKETIIRKFESGESKVSELAKEYDRHRTTIYNVINGRTNEGTPSRGDRYDDSIRGVILSCVRHDHKVAAWEIQDAMDTKVSISTINRILREEGSVCRGRRRPDRFIVPPIEYQ